MYNVEIIPSLQSILEKLEKKNKPTYEVVINKISQIIIDPNRYKNLRRPLQHLKRVHINKNFVLTFQVIHNIRIVKFINFDHHDNIYKN